MPVPGNISEKTKNRMEHGSMRFEKAGKNQRLENWGARRAALRPYCAGPQTRIHCAATVSGLKNVSHRKFNLKQRGGIKEGILATCRTITHTP